MPFPGIVRIWPMSVRRNRGKIRGKSWTDSQATSSIKAGIIPLHPSFSRDEKSRHDGVREMLHRLWDNGPKESKHQLVPTFHIMRVTCTRSKISSTLADNFSRTYRDSQISTTKKSIVLSMKDLHLKGVKRNALGHRPTSKKSLNSKRSEKLVRRKSGVTLEVDASLTEVSLLTKIILSFVIEQNHLFWESAEPTRKYSTDLLPPIGTNILVDEGLTCGHAIRRSGYEDDSKEGSALEDIEWPSLQKLLHFLPCEESSSRLRVSPNTTSPKDYVVVCIIIYYAGKIIIS